jgi:hypothetical protein
MKIFLSHRSRDKALVREFKELLPSFLTTWIDEDSLTWGQSFPAALKTTIQSAVDFLVIFLDGEATRSRWVMQELEWAVEREQELKRTFILPIMLEPVAPESLPAGLSERLLLRLSDFSHASVEELARKATMKIFQLLVESYSSLQLEIPPHKSLQEVRDGLTASQAKLLGYLVKCGGSGSEIAQRQIEQQMGMTHASAELYYRLESLIHQGFVNKRRVAADGLFGYRLTEEFLALLNEA